MRHPRRFDKEVFTNEVNNQILRNFDLGSQDNLSVPIWIFVGFKQRDTQGSQNLNNDTSFRLPVTSAQCIIGAQKDPDAGILEICDDDDYSKGYGWIKEAFRALTKKDNLQSFLSDNGFRFANVRVADVSSILFVLDIQCQEKSTASQPIEVEFKFDGVFCNDINGYVLVLQKKITKSSYGGRINDLIQVKKYIFLKTLSFSFSVSCVFF